MFGIGVIERLKLTGIHILFSALLLCIAITLVYGIWYPKPLDVALGVTSIYLMLLAIDLIVGPLLTFIVYKKDKRKLKFDLMVILILQLSAYIFGLYTLAQGRPVWQVFVVNDIELISPIDIKKTKDYQMKEEFKSSIFKKPQWVAAVYSTDKTKQQQQKEDEMFEGINLSGRPETYQKLSVKKDKILLELKSVDELRQFNTNKAEIEQSITRYPEVVGWLPMKAPEQDMVVFFDKDAHPIAIVNLRPWN